MREFAKQKTLASPITTLPTDAKKFFAAIDGPQSAAAAAPVQAPPAELQTPRERPEVSADNLNQPISITL